MANLAQFSEIWGEVLDHGFSASRYQTYAKRLVNEAQTEIAKRIDLRVFEAVLDSVISAGISSITLPADFLRPRYVHNLTDDVPLQPIGSFSEFEVLPVSSGQPQVYIIDGSTSIYQLWPTNDGSRTLRLAYYKNPQFASPLSGDTDVPLLPQPYRQALVSYAVWHCYRRGQEFQAADYFRNEWERELLRLGIELQHDAQAKNAPQQIPGAW